MKVTSPLAEQCKTSTVTNSQEGTQISPEDFHHIYERKETQASAAQDSNPQRRLRDTQSVICTCRNGSDRNDLTRYATPPSNPMIP